MISLALFVTGVIDRAGNLNHMLPTPRVREGEHGGEYVVAWAGETAGGRDIVLTKVDVDNLLRAKAAIYAGYTVLCASVGVDPSEKNIKTATVHAESAILKSAAYGGSAFIR